MKQQYESVEMEIIRFESEDVITNSCPSDQFVCPDDNGNGGD